MNSMKTLLKMLAVLVLTPLCYAQYSGVGSYSSTPVNNFTITMTANGAGTGSVSDNQSQIDCVWNGSSTSGTCTGSYPSGTLILLTPTTTGGSSFAWGTNSFGCSGTGACTFNITANGTAVAHYSPSGGTTILPAMAGIGINSGFPSIPFGNMRDWDTCGAEWSFIPSCNASSCVPNDSNLVYNYATSCSKSSGFDTWSADAFNSGVKVTMMTLGSRTPLFATSNPTDTSCNYNGTGAGQSPGQCDPPSDLQTNGTNGNSCSSISTELCNLYFRYWVKNMMQHVTNSTWLLTHAPMTYLEPLNEPDTAAFSKATYDQQGRMIADMAQLIVGDSNWNMTLSAVTSTCTYTVSNFNGNPSGATGTYSPSGYYVGYHVNITGMGVSGNNVTNATITSSTSGSITTSTCAHSAETHSGNLLIVNTYTGETAAQTQSSVGLSGPLNSSAIIMTSSYHPQNFNTSLTKFICEMYCSGSCSASNSCTTGGSAFFTQAINMHIKPGNDDPTTLENDTNNSTTNTNNALDAQDQTKQFYDPEAAYSASGWKNGSCVPGSCSTPPYDNYSDAGMEAAYLLRLYIYFTYKGWVSITWYNWKGTLGSNLANSAYTAIYNDLLGITVPSCSTSNQSGSSGNYLYTYTCTYTDANSVASAFIWDTSQYCNNNNTSATSAQCVSVNRTVSNSYTHWIPLVNMTIGSTTYPAGTPVSIVSNTVPVTILPVELQ